MKYQYWLASVAGLSGRKKVQLLDLVGSAEELYKIKESQLRKLEIISDLAKELLLTARKGESWEREYQEFLQQDVQLICWEQPTYPKKLRNIYDMPYGIFVKGALPEETEKLVAIVGARSCSVYGSRVSEKIGCTLGEHGIGVISGLAYGIDAAAHEGALKGNGATYAVMGCGVDVCYPRQNQKLYHKIAEQGGILSEYPMGTGPMKHLFPQRNRIISALADAVIVVEAKKRSGSLITADFALEYGKNVYAVPGRITDDLSYGTNWLLSQGAQVLFSLEEFLQDMQVFSEKNNTSEKLIENSLEKNERLVYSVLDLTPKYLENILEETELNFLEALESLSVLKEHGLTEEVYKNYYIKSGL